MDVVVAVSVAVCAVVLLMLTEVGERLHVTGLEAFDGDVVTAQDRATVPVNEVDGVTVIVEVLPEVSPGLATLIAPLLDRVKSEVELIGSQNPLQPPRRKGTGRKGSTSIQLAHTRLVVIIPNLRVQGKLLPVSIHPGCIRRTGEFFFIPLRDAGALHFAYTRMRFGSTRRQRHTRRCRNALRFVVLSPISFC